MLYSNKYEWTTDTCNNMDAFHRYSIEWKKPGTKDSYCLIHLYEAGEQEAWVVVIEIWVVELLCWEGAMHKPSRVLEIFCILICVLVACVHPCVKTHQAVHLRLVHLVCTTNIQCKQWWVCSGVWRKWSRYFTCICHIVWRLCIVLFIENVILRPAK